MTLTPHENAALTHLRDRYPDLTHHTDPELEAFDALARVAAQLQHDPSSVDRTTAENALRLVNLAKTGRKSATLTLLSEARTQDDTLEQIADLTGYAGASQVHQRLKRLRSDLGVREIDQPVRPHLPEALKVARRHLTTVTGPTPLLELAAPLLAVWLLHRPRPNLRTWLEDPTPPADLPDTNPVLDSHVLLPAGTRTDVHTLLLDATQPPGGPVSTPNTLAPVYATAAAALRRLAHTGKPLHPRILLALADQHEALASNTLQDNITLGDWGAFDEPGHAHTYYDLATMIGSHHA